MSDTLTHALLNAYHNHRHRIDGATLYLACSGGRDSLSMAYACYQLYQAGQMDRLPILLHVHHGWQQTNDDWAKLVATWATAHGFDCRILPVTLPKNSETHARTARYDAMLSVMQDNDALMLAHHAHDQAETVLYRLIHGAGVQGLAGMKSWQAKSSHDKQVWLWRPWLGVTRKDISQFASTHKLPFVDDATNTDTAYARGRLRTLIMPLLTDINPRAVENIVRSAELLAKSAEWQQHSTDTHLAQLSCAETYPPYQAVMEIERFNQVPTSAKSSILHQWLQGDEPLPPSHKTIQSVLGMIARTDNDHASQMIWQGAHHSYVVCCYDGRLYRYRADVWRLLTAGVQADNLASVGDGLGHEHRLDKFQSCELTLVADGQLRIVFKSHHVITHAQKMDKTTSVIISNHTYKHTYKGKKLAQKLRLPPWLRAHLWQVHIGADAWLIAPMCVWRLGDLTPVALDNFAPIGRMVYNG